jgi:phi13 family phage major tail protein
MANNSTVKAQRQSLRNIHYAILKTDNADGATYEKPEPLVGAISASISPTTNQEKLWADDGVFDVASQLGDITLELELAALPMKAQAALLGHRYDKGVMIQNARDEAPYVAIGFMSQPQPNQFMCVWLYKGKFQLVEDEYSTSNDSPAWRQPKLTGTFVQRDYDGNWQISADTSDPDFTGVDAWFNAVYEAAKTTDTNGEE